MYSYINSLKHIQFFLLAAIVFLGSKNLNVNIPAKDLWFKPFVDFKSYERPVVGVTSLKLDIKEEKAVIQKVKIQKSAVIKTVKKNPKSPKKLNAIVFAPAKEKKINISKNDIKDDFVFRSPSYQQPKKFLSSHESVSTNDGIETKAVEVKKFKTENTWVAYLEQHQFEGGKNLVAHLESLDVQKVEVTNDKEALIANVSDSPKKEDSVQQKSSGLNKIQSKNQELVFYSYEEEPKAAPESQMIKSYMTQIGKQLEDKKSVLISSNVASSIQREMNRQDSWNVAGKMKKAKKVYYNEGAIQEPKTPEPTVPSSEVDDFFEQKSTDSDYPKIKIYGSTFYLGSSKSEPLKNFEMVPWYDHDEFYYDDDGVIDFPINSKSVNSQFDATLRAQEVIPVNFNAFYDEKFNRGDDERVFIPFFQRGQFFEFLSSNSVNLGDIEDLGHVLVRVNDESGVSLDSNNLERFFFNSNFEIVKENEAAYVLFVGVRKGNVLLSHQLSDGSSAQKIIHVIRNEITFDNDHFEKEREHSFNLVERKLLSFEGQELDISEYNIKFFNRNIHSSKNGLSNYKMPLPKRFLGFRDYLEFTHLNDSVFVGSKGSSRVEVPSQKFLDYIKDSFDIRHGDNSCVVQVNLSNKVQRISYDGIAYNGYMKLINFALDRDGVVTEEVTELASNLFFKGEFEGIINLKLEYLDGTVDYLRTVCSKSTYLIEQL